jgi:hypothetical protein
MYIVKPHIITSFYKFYNLKMCNFLLTKPFSLCEGTNSSVRNILPRYNDNSEENEESDDNYNEEADYSYHERNDEENDVNYDKEADYNYHEENNDSYGED